MSIHDELDLFMCDVFVGDFCSLRSGKIRRTYPLHYIDRVLIAHLKFANICDPEAFDSDHADCSDNH
jgi:hypothetical protein